MLPKPKSFKFSLDPLIKKNNWELEILELEVSRISEVIAQKRCEIGVLEDSIEATQREILQLSHNKRLDLDRHRILNLFLKHQLETCEPLRGEIVQATQLRDQAANQLIKVWRGLDGLEKLKNRCRNEYTLAAQRAKFKEDDDQWIMRFRNVSY